VSLIAAALKHMLAAGMPHDAIVAAVADMEAAAGPVRSKGAARTAAWRERHKASQSVTSDESDACDASLSPEQKPPTPHKTQPLSLKENPPKGGQKKGDDWPRDANERFWQLFPKKVGKQAVFAKLDRLRRDGVDYETITAGVRRYLDSDPETEFIPHPLTWLNQGRWDDEPSPPKTNGSHHAQASLSDVARELRDELRQAERGPELLGIRSG
jgi:hypothetical protein